MAQTEIPTHCTSVITNKLGHRPEQKCGHPLEIIGHGEKTALVCPKCDQLDHKGEPMLRERKE